MYINNGWPENRQNVEEEARVFFDFREELTVKDGILLKGTKLIVPKLLRR